MWPSEQDQLQQPGSQIPRAAQAGLLARRATHRKRQWQEATRQVETLKGTPNGKEHIGSGNLPGPDNFFGCHGHAASGRISGRGHFDSAARLGLLPPECSQSDVQDHWSPQGMGWRRLPARAAGERWVDSSGSSLDHACPSMRRSDWPAESNVVKFCSLFALTVQNGPVGRRRPGRAKKTPKNTGARHIPSALESAARYATTVKPAGRAPPGRANRG